jgi:hypothetical protein
MLNYEECCNNCMWCDNPTPTMQPCTNWKTCLANDYSLFEPNGICKFKAWFKVVLGKLCCSGGNVKWK